MRITMMTNTYSPHVGGVARSVGRFTDELRRRGHQTLVVAPKFKDSPADEVDTLRVPAIQNFNGSDFAVQIPTPGLVYERVEKFRPDIIHSHHPFLLGETALRTAATMDLPLVFTHHTMYEWYTHYVPGDSEQMKRFVVELSTGYANMCDAVVAPSESLARVLRERGVESRIEVIPTGVDAAKFREGDGAAARKSLGLPQEAFVVGHVGRLAPEKNLGFLARAAAEFLKKRDDAYFVVVGGGPSEQEIRTVAEEAGVSERVILAGVMRGDDLVNIYHAMDVFAFASHTETQGMVLTEAMAAGTPVVAVDAPGAREVVNDTSNGRLLEKDDEADFAAALEWVASRSEKDRESLRRASLETAERFSMPACAERAIRLYEFLIQKTNTSKPVSESLWESALRSLECEWDLWSNRVHAASVAISGRLGKPVGKKDAGGELR
ncbi:MAG: glycosyltransferase family 4 protein [Phycisphaeraceae bacterium]|nr:MAG: glycosyltransferase family 4 protein [Phycisphaeraceae bacterium]